MKIKKIICAILSALLLTPTVYAAPFGDIYYSPSRKLTDGLEYTQLYTYNEAAETHQRAYVLDYNPRSNDVLPLVTCGGSVFGRKTLDTMIGYKLKDPKKLAAAVNCDFFSMKTGVPMGVVIESGLIFTGAENLNCFMITDDGRASITTADIKIKMTSSGGKTTDIDYYNKYPTKYGVYMLSSFYGSSTESTLVSREIVLRAADGAFMKPNGQVTASVTEIRSGVTNTKIPDGCFVLSYAEEGTAGKNEILNGLKKGDTVTFEASCDTLPQNVRLAVGGADVILRNGVFDATLVDEEHEKLENPRTAVGIRIDGSVVFFAVDGRRKGFSNGLTLSELADEMRSLGCVDALNLDGGGSTTVVVNSAGTPVTVNRPTEGGQRKISNAVLFVKSDEFMKIEKLDISPVTCAVLSDGGSVPLTVKFGGVEIAPEKLSYDISPSSAGKIKNGIFTASGRTGKCTVTISADIGGRKISGVCEITAVSSLTDFEIVPSENVCDAGGEISLALTAKLYNADVNVGFPRMKCSISGTERNTEAGEICASNLGFLTSDGILHIAETAFGTLILTISYGLKTQYINIEISEKPKDDIPPEIELPPLIFSDTTGHWAEQYINAAYTLGIVSGDLGADGRLFRPSDTLTREQFAKMCASFLGLDITSAQPAVYADKMSEWAVPYVNAIIGAGYMHGKSADENGTVTFAAYDSITRTEVLQVLGSLLPATSQSADLTAYTDATEIPQWAADNFARSVGARLVKGYTDGTLKPLETVTRAEIATMFMRLNELNAM